MSRMRTLQTLIAVASLKSSSPDPAWGSSPCCPDCRNFHFPRYFPPDRCCLPHCFACRLHHHPHQHHCSHPETSSASPSVFSPALRRDVSPTVEKCIFLVGIVNKEEIFYATKYNPRSYIAFYPNCSAYDPGNKQSITHSTVCTALHPYPPPHPAPHCHQHPAHRSASARDQCPSPCPDRSSAPASLSRTLLDPHLCIHIHVCIHMHVKIGD